MDNLQKNIMNELDELIKQAPDVDMAAELQNWVENHYKVLADKGNMLEGIVPKLLLANAICQFQHNFMVGANVSKHVNFLLQLAATLGYNDLVKQFGDEKRMQQMSKIFEQKSVDIITQGRKADKEKGRRPRA